MSFLLSWIALRGAATSQFAGAQQFGFVSWVGMLFAVFCHSALKDHANHLQQLQMLGPYANGEDATGGDP
ncbi:1-phosphofructokinase [Cupriavidus sp. PET2-C1]